MGSIRKYLTWFFIILCILGIVYILRLKFTSYNNVWNPHKGAVVVLNDSNANIYNPQDMEKNFNLDLSMLKIKNGIITDAFFTKVDWYLTNIFEDKLEKILIYTGNQYHIYQVWTSNGNIILNTSEGYYQLNLKSGEILELDKMNGISNEYLVYSEWPEEGGFTNQSFCIDYSESEIYNLLSRRVRIHGIVDNTAIVQILPNTSNDEHVSLNAFLESLRFGINSSDFSIFYLNLKESKFLRLDLSSEDNRKWYMNIKYINTDYNEKILNHFQNVINYQDNIH